MERESFIFYASFYDAIKELPEENQLKIYQAVVKFAITGKETEELTGIDKAIFSLIKPQIVANNERYENGCKGGAPKGNQNARKTTKNNQKQPTVVFQNNQKQPNENENDNDNVNENDIKRENNIKEKKNNLQAKNDLPELVVSTNRLPEPKQNATKSPQSVVFEYFSQKYRKHTGIEYLSEKKDFVILSKLIAKYGIDLVKQKIDWLEIGCLHAVFWFTQDINDFTIGKLQSQWNYILPKLTAEQKQQQKQKQAEDELKARVMANVAKRNQLKLGGNNVRTN